MDRKTNLNSKTLLSISLINYNNMELLKKCLISIYKNIRKIKFEVLLVDNASKDGSVKMVQQLFPKVKLIKNKKNLIFTKAHNQNLSKIRGKYFLVLNEDIQIFKHSIEEIISFLESNPKTGLASCAQIDETGKIDKTCSRLPHPLLEFFEYTFTGKVLRKILNFKKIERGIKKYRYFAWNRKSIRQVEVLPGSFLLGKTELLKKVGLFDENLLLFYEEPDLCQRARKKGYLSFHLGKVKVMHLKSRAIAKLPIFTRYRIAEHDLLNYYKKYFGYKWYLFLWFSLRPNWLYWRIKSIND